VCVCVCVYIYIYIIWRIAEHEQVCGWWWWWWWAMMTVWYCSQAAVLEGQPAYSEHIHRRDAPHPHSRCSLQQTVRARRHRLRRLGMYIPSHKHTHVKTKICVMCSGSMHTYHNTYFTSLLDIFLCACHVCVFAHTPPGSASLRNVVHVRVQYCDLRNTLWPVRGHPTPRCLVVCLLPKPSKAVLQRLNAFQRAHFMTNKKKLAISDECVKLTFEFDSCCRKQVFGATLQGHAYSM
jgi:hypothetical protein